ncbi:MAG: hypothetical protein ABIS03_10225 [Gemmatimonadaceae bacterium]
MSATDPLLITDTDMAGVLKNVYTKFRVNSFPIATPLLAQVKKGSPGGPESMKWGGNGVYWDVRLGRPVNMVFSQAGYFGQPSQVKEKQASLGIKRSYVTRHIDQLAAVGTESKEAAFVPLARKIVEEALDASRLGQQEALHGDALGIKAIVTTASSSTSLICQKPYGITGAGQGGLLLDKDMYVEVLDSTGATSRGKSLISAASNSGDSCTITLATALSGQTSTDIVVAATASDNSYNQATNGLTNIMNRGGSYNLFEGISAATDTRWDTLRLTAGTDTPDAAQPSEMDVWQLIRQVAGRSGKDAQMAPDEFLLLTTPGIAKAIGESFLGQRRFDMGQKTLKGGFGAIELCGLPLVTDAWCPAGTLYLIHVPSLTWVDSLDWQKIQFESQGPWRFISGRDAYEVTFGAYWNFGALQRITHGMITGYTDTARYTHVI